MTSSSTNAVANCPTWHTQRWQVKVGQNGPAVRKGAEIYAVLHDLPMLLQHGRTDDQLESAEKAEADLQPCQLRLAHAADLGDFGVRVA